MIDELICTVCPLGCTLEVEFGKVNLVSIKGNRCARGIPYAEKEILNPERVVTTTVAVSGGALPLLPVKKTGSVPLGRVAEVMRETRKIIVDAPVRMGECIARNICSTRADLIATRTIPKKPTRPQRKKTKRSALKTKKPTKKKKNPLL